MSVERGAGGRTGLPVDEPVAGVPSDNTTLTAILDDLADGGFTVQFVPLEGGLLQCAGCNSTSPASSFRVDHSRRLEGASDPDDMVRAVATHCPACGAGGTFVLGYGVNASDIDADIATTLRDHAGSTAPIGAPVTTTDGSAEEFLPLYLRDHHAASNAGVALARRSRDLNAGNHYHQPLHDLVVELVEEQQMIVKLLDSLGTNPSRVKPFIGRAAEFVARLKPNGRATSYSPLSRMIEFEALAAGICSKRQMWRSFASLDPATCRVVDKQMPKAKVAELEQQATRQFQTMIRLHAQASRDTFGE